MKPLHPIPQCIDCLSSLARDVAVLADPDDPTLIAKAEHIARDLLAEVVHHESSSPRVANQILRKIRQISGIADPYQTFKAREMEQAGQIFRRLKLGEAANLKACVKLAALGNSLDFFKDPAQALADIPHQYHNRFSFYYDHLDQLEDFLATHPERILYFSDNAGEIYFDLPLYDCLKRYCRQLYLVVKGGPALNDLTRAELESAQLENRFDHIADTGADGAGVDWDNVSAEFLDLLASADLIVSKGMANFETLYPQRMAAASFYLFKIKCEPIHNYIQAPVDSFLALWKEGSAAG